MYKRKTTESFGRKYVAMQMLSNVSHVYSSDRDHYGNGSCWMDPFGRLEGMWVWKEIEYEHGNGIFQVTVF